MRIILAGHNALVTRRGWCFEAPQPGIRSGMSVDHHRLRVVEAKRASAPPIARRPRCPRHSRGDASLEVPDELTVDERAELERLRRETATLRADGSQPRRPIRWRSVLAVVLIVVRLRVDAGVAGCGLDPQ